MVLHEAARAAPLQPHTRRDPCPICGGHADLAKGRGQRCWGVTGEWRVWCTREELAGPLTEEGYGYPHRRFGTCPCGTAHAQHEDADAAAPRALPVPRPDRAEPLPAETRNALYRAALAAMPTLRANAAADLLRRGLSPEAILRGGFRSTPRKGHELAAWKAAILARFPEAVLRRAPGFTDKNGRFAFSPGLPGGADGYVVPYMDEADRVLGWQVKVLSGKYLTPSGDGVVRHLYAVAGPAPQGRDTYLTEGGLKGFTASHHAGLTTFSVPGQALTPEHIAAIVRLQPARVVIALDREANPNTDRARARWEADLLAAGLTVARAVWEGEDAGGAKGLDDLVYAGGRPRIRPTHQDLANTGAPVAPYATETPGAVDRGQPLDEVRRQGQRAIKDFLHKSRKNAGAALVVRNSAGTGKTTVVAEELAKSGSGVLYTSTHRHAEEVAARYDLVHIKGRTKETCHESRLPVVQALGAGGFHVGQIACGSYTEPRCPFRRTCAYYEQFRQGGAWVTTADQIFNTNVVDHSGPAVLDDVDLERVAIERFHFNTDTLARAVDQLAGKQREPVRRLLRVVQHAIVDAPRHQFRQGGPSLLGADVWDLLARTARRNGSDLAELVRALPERPTMPEPAGDGDGIVHVEDMAEATPAALVHLLRALQAELPRFVAGGPFNSALRLSVRGLDLGRMREHVRRPGALLPAIAERPLLIVDGNPNNALVDQFTRHHRRIPDVGGTATIPTSVRIEQHAEHGGNGHGALGEQKKREAAVRSVATARAAHPCDRPDQEVAVCFKDLRRDLEGIGLAGGQVLTYGNLRSSNAGVNAEVLYLVGRPHPESDGLLHLAHVLHHDESPLDSTTIRRPAAYGGQPYAVNVLDYRDPRLAALLRHKRDDELIQAVHRIRPSLLTVTAPQLRLDAAPGAGLAAEAQARTRVTIHIFSSHPIPGLRVDALHLPAEARDVNGERRADADARCAEAVALLRDAGTPVTVTAVARLAGADKRTAARCVGNAVDTPMRDLVGVSTSVPTTLATMARARPPDQDELQPIPLEIAPVLAAWEQAGGPHIPLALNQQGKPYISVGSRETLLRLLTKDSPHRAVAIQWITEHCPARAVVPA